LSNVSFEITGSFAVSRHDQPPVNAVERPLGLYVSGNDQQLIENILNDTNPVGAAIDACAIQRALPLPTSCKPLFHHRLQKRPR
jgi:hypothetical protein